jgi:hypothetical protein
MDAGNYIPMDKLVRGRVYRISARNFSIAVYADEGRFIGFREKFGVWFLFTEYHWDTGEPFGTVKPLEDMGVSVPQDVQLIIGSRDSRCFTPNRALEKFLHDLDTNVKAKQEREEQWRRAE